MKRLLLLLIATMSLVVRVQALSDNAKWIVCKQSRGKSLPMLKGTFTLDERRRSATMQATALGIYDVRVNGQSVTEHELKPGWTDYRKEVTYQTMEIGKFLRKGENEICVQLSSGWWAGLISRNAYGRNQPLAFRAEVESEGETLIATDDSWLCCEDGPLMVGDIYLGETYDSRRTPKTWNKAETSESIETKTIPFEGPEVRIRDKKMWRHPLSTVIYSKTKDTGTEYGEIIVDRSVGDKPFVLRKGERLWWIWGRTWLGGYASRPRLQAERK